MALTRSEAEPSEVDPLDTLPRGEAKRATVRAMFDRIAPRYDRLNRILSFGLDRRWRARALAAIGVGPGDRVLDVACGTGDLAALATARGAEAIGLDFSVRMLAHARGREPGARGVRWIHADAASLPLRNGLATAVVCGFALRNFVRLEPVFAEMARVLAPQGRLALLEIATPERSWLRAGHNAYFEHVVPRVGGWLADREAYAYLPRSTAYLPDEKRLLELLREAGFREARAERLGFGMTRLYTGIRA